MAQLGVLATELRLNETVIPMIETVEPSVEVDTMLYSEREEAGVYDHNTPEAETASETQNMTAVDDKATETVQTEWAYPLTESELRLIALIAELEDRGAMSEIAEVILNRTLSPKFPDSIEGVIYQPKQFHTTGLITDDMMPSDGAVQAVEAVFRDGISTVGGSLFFAEKSTAASSIAKGLYLMAERGGSSFYGQE